MGAPVGNQNAAKSKEWKLAIRRALAHKFGSYDKGLERLASKLVDKADEGDMNALKEIGDREDGKPAQAIGGDSEGIPVSMSVTWIPPARD